MDGVGLEGEVTHHGRDWKAGMFTVQRRGFLASEAQVSNQEALSAERRALVAGAQGRGWEKDSPC